jgi:MFS family permease
VIASALYAAATPSPLYAVYQARWHFSTPTVSLVYAVYAFGVLTSLLLIGGISDHAGRRPVLAWSLLLLLVSMLLFAVARSVAWLFAARVLQGLATGAVLGAAGADLIDLHPRGDARRAALANGAVTLGGLGAGALVTSLLVQLLPAPRVLPFVVVSVLILILLVLIRATPEPVRQHRPRLRPQRPAVPEPARRPFVLVGLAALSSWSIAGVYLALGPGLAEGLLHTHHELVGGVAVAALTTPGALAQLAGHALSNRTLISAGALIVGAGMALIAAAVATGSGVLFLITSGATGVGLGLAFMGGLRHLSGAVPPSGRGGLMSAFYVVGYLSLSLPAIAAGLTASAFGLPHTFELFAAATVLLSVAVAVGGLRMREASVSQLTVANEPTSGRSLREAA